MPRFTITKLLVFTIIAAVCSNAMAKTEKKARWYQVNLTIFKQKTNGNLDESFKSEPIELNMPDIIHLKGHGKGALAQGAMNASMALNHDKLSPNGPYQPQSIDKSWTKLVRRLDPARQPILYNMQWVQPVYDNKHDIPLYIETSVNEMGQPQLQGLMYLHVTRYLHTKFHLNYWPDGADSAKDLVTFESSRRMRSKEVHYLDHPLVGVMVRMLPVDTPASKKEVAHSGG